MAQVLNQLRQREGAAGSVVAQLGCGHHHLGVGWALLVDGAAFLAVVVRARSRLAASCMPSSGCSIRPWP